MLYHFFRCVLLGMIYVDPVCRIEGMNFNEPLLSEIGKHSASSVTKRLDAFAAKIVDLGVT